MMIAQPKAQTHRNRKRVGYRLICGSLLAFALLLLLLAGCSRSRKEAPEGSASDEDSLENQTRPSGDGEPFVSNGQAVSTPNPDPGAAPIPAEQQSMALTEIDLGAEGIHSGMLVLVNADYGFDPSGVQTVSVWEKKTGSYLVKDVYTAVAPTAMEQLNAWMDAFAAATGRTDVNVVAGYRSYETQAALYENAVQTKGQAHADRYLALPGHSEHHTGLAVDLNIYELASGASRDFDGTGDYAWALEHAWEYGFVQRYPVDKHAITGIDYESWHYRYVGRPHAMCMRQRNLCLEEYIDYLRGFPADGTHLSVDCGGDRYEIWYCAGSVAAVPEVGEYTVSGNNVDGYIVTALLP